MYFGVIPEGRMFDIEFVNSNLSKFTDLACQFWPEGYKPSLWGPSFNLFIGMAKGLFWLRHH